jgi:hypothetical protein
VTIRKPIYFDGMAFLRKNECTLLPTINMLKPEHAYLAGCSSDGKQFFFVLT